jgi:anti-sigma regulatory factor (Ser/Thr protein kinase)
MSGMQGAMGNLDEIYNATADSVPRARRRLADFAKAAGATPRQVDAVRLAASEAITNVVLHAYQGQAGSIYVNAAVVSDELWILISDDGCGLQPRADRSGLGLGLGLISEVSDDFAIVSRATGGTEVRLRFNVVNAGAGADCAPGSRAGGRRLRRSEVGRATVTRSTSFG